MTNPLMLSDLEVRWRPLADSEEPYVQALLNDAWAIASSQIPALISLDVASPAADVVRAVLSAMVIRVLRNPEGVRTWSVDDYSQTRDASVAGGSLYLSAEELALIDGSLGRRRRGAFSITPSDGEVHRSRGSEYAYGYGPEWPDRDGYRW
jgi:hypothetical protein